MGGTINVISYLSHRARNFMKTSNSSVQFKINQPTYKREFEITEAEFRINPHGWQIASLVEERLGELRLMIINDLKQMGRYEARI